MGSLIPLFWTSGDISSVFQSGGRGIHVTCSLRFTSGVTPADLLASSLAAKLFSSMYLQAGIGGARNWDLLYHHSRCETRQVDERFTDWAMPLLIYFILKQESLSIHGSWYSNLTWEFQSSTCMQPKWFKCGIWTDETNCILFWQQCIRDLDLFQ